MAIKGLGTGCARCKSTIALNEQVTKHKGVAVTPVPFKRMTTVLRSVVVFPGVKHRQAAG